MNYNDIPGDVTAEGHEKWIELTSFDWGVGRDISSPTGASADRESSAPSVNEITVTKATDESTPKLFDEAYRGSGQHAQIDFCKTDQGALEVYLTLNLENCMISSDSLSSGGDRPTESLSINFTKVEIKNTAMGADAKAGSPESIVYDVGLAKVV
jgi:type VI secretion system secreted protein Hcp